MWLIDDNSHLWYQLLEFQKFVEMEIIMVFGICTRWVHIEYLSFMKTKLHNWLTEHLPHIVAMKCQAFYDLWTFHYDVAYNSWKAYGERQCGN